MVNIRKAEVSEAELLTDIAARSEAYWGYGKDFMDSFRIQYKVTEEMIDSQPTFIMEENGVVIGFYNLLSSDMETSLEYFYIETGYIGKGYGKLLWQHMADYCKNQGIREIAFVTSPQAVGFYTRMGAVQTGETDSIVLTKRRIPKLLYKSLD